MTDGEADCRAMAGASYRGWIPAFEGMTDGWAACWATAGASYRGWIPAFEGMTDGGVGQGMTGRS